MAAVADWKLNEWANYILQTKKDPFFHVKIKQTEKFCSTEPPAEGMIKRHPYVKQGKLYQVKWMIQNIKNL